MTAAYLYTLSLDDVSLAWEYLRRNCAYRALWKSARHRRISAEAGPWGLRHLEDPNRDARVVHPLWRPAPPSSVHLTRASAEDRSGRFRLWVIPGEKSLVHDGFELQLTARVNAAIKRAAIAPDLESDEPYAFCVPANHLNARCRALKEFATFRHPWHPRKCQGSRDPPSRAVLIHMRTLQAYDGALTRASQREIAVALFGAKAVADHWKPESELRAQVRYLLRRGRVLTAGGYRGLINADSRA